MTTHTKQAAQNALWHALEERRENLRAEKLWTGRTEQQHRKLEAAYDDGRLIDALVEAMERRARTSVHSDVHLRQMAKVIKAGHPIWEQILIEPNKPWSRYFGGVSFARAPRERSGTRRPGRNGAEPSRIEIG